MTNPKVSMVFLDLDETLLSKDGAQREDIHELLMFLSEQKIKPAFSTGRGLYFVNKLLRGRTELMDQLFVLYDGAVVVNPLSKEILHGDPVSEEAVESLRNSEYAKSIFFNGLKALYSIENSLESKSSLFEFWRSLDALDEPVYQIYGRNISLDQKDTLIQTLRGLDIDAYAFVYRGDPTRFSLLGVKNGNSKGKALVKVSEKTGVPTSEMMVVGDGINDIPAFEIGAFNVATENAIEELKSKAQIVLPAGQTILQFLEKNFSSKG